MIICVVFPASFIVTRFASNSRLPFLEPVALDDGASYACVLWLIMAKIWVFGGEAFDVCSYRFEGITDFASAYLPIMRFIRVTRYAKDFPVCGYVEMRYFDCQEDVESCRIINPVSKLSCWKWHARIFATRIWSMINDAELPKLYVLVLVAGPQHSCSKHRVFALILELNL